MEPTKNQSTNQTSTNINPQTSTNQKHRQNTQNHHRPIRPIFGSPPCYDGIVSSTGFTTKTISYCWDLLGIYPTLSQSNVWFKILTSSFCWFIQPQFSSYYPLLGVYISMKSPCFMGKTTSSMAIFNSKLLVYQRVYPLSFLLVKSLFITIKSHDDSHIQPF